MEILWTFSRVSLGILSGFFGDAVGILWNLVRDSLLGFSVGIPWGFLGDSLVIPGGFKILGPRFQVVHCEIVFA